MSDQEMILYCDWLRNFETVDPEPPLKALLKDSYEVITPRGTSIGNGLHYNTAEMVDHVLWHRRMTDAYYKEKDQIL